MHHRALRVIAFVVPLALAGLASRASAQDSVSRAAVEDTASSAAAGQAAPSPEWRVDVDIPAGGGVVMIDPSSTFPGGAASVGAWYTHRSGHGFMARAMGLILLRGGLGAEVAYQYSFTLSGDSRSGVSLAPYVGLFGGTYLGSALNPAAGPLLGATLDFRVWNFNAGIDVSYRTMFTSVDNLFAAPTGVALMLRLGFAFWGN